MSDVLYTRRASTSAYASLRGDASGFVPESRQLRINSAGIDLPIMALDLGRPRRNSKEKVCAHFGSTGLSGFLSPWPLVAGLGSGAFGCGGGGQ